MHEHHRDRVRARYRMDGFESFATHEILESLLFTSIPRGDTNELSHRLLERFGSLHGVLEASEDELLTVEGVGEKTAFLLKLIPEIMRRYALEMMEKVPTYNTLSAIGDYLCRRFIGCGTECVYMMMLDNRLSLIDCCKVSEGSVNNSTVPIRAIAERAVFRKVPIVVLAHNHPHGLAVPSGSDREVTEQVALALQLVGVTLLEHLVIADDRVWPIMQSGFASQRVLPEEVLQTNPTFLSDYYDVDCETWRADLAGPFLRLKGEGKGKGDGK